MSAELLPADIPSLQPAQPPAVAATPFAAATHPDAVEAMGCLHPIQVAVDPTCPASSADSSHSAGREVAVAPPPRATAVAVPPAHVPSAAQAAFQPAAQAALEQMEALQAAALEVVAPPQLWLLMAVVCRAGMSQQTVSNM